MSSTPSPQAHPRFDEPTFTVPAAELFADGVPDLAHLDRPLPAFDEAEVALDAGAMSDEPLVRVEHRRIRVLANYWHAGWANAIAGTWLRTGVVDRLAAAADELPPRWGLAIFDAWRPLALQRELYDAAYADPDTEPGFMAPVSDDPATPPPHLTGGAVDVTLTYDAVPIAAGTGFDDTTHRAFTNHLEDRPGPDRHLRRALYHTLANNGFVVFRGEWWHFEHGTRRWAALRGETARYGPSAPPT